MREPTIIQIDPKKLQDGVRSPEFVALLSDGWQVATSTILEDPRRPPEDQHRLALVMVPPVPVARVDLPRWVVGLLVAQVVATLGLLALAGYVVASLAG